MYYVANKQFHKGILIMSFIKVITINPLLSILPKVIKEHVILRADDLFKLQKYSKDSWDNNVKGIFASPSSKEVVVIIEDPYWAMLLGTDGWFKVMISVEGTYHIVGSSDQIVFVLQALFTSNELLVTMG